MQKFVRRLSTVAMAGLGALAVGTVVMPAVSSADCAYGELWDPLAKLCRPVGVQLPKNCGLRLVGPVDQRLSSPRVPLGCENGAWWDPTANVCRPPVLPPP